MRNPGVAAVLSFFWPGVGQIYNGELAKGLVLFFLQPFIIAACGATLFLLVPLIFVGVSQVQPVLAVIASSVIGALAIGFPAFVWVGSMYDAYINAERFNEYDATTAAALKPPPAPPPVAAAFPPRQ